MGILQEYRFYIIIALIALITILVVFFNTQQTQEYMAYDTDFKSQYIKLKTYDHKTLKDVAVNTNGELLGTQNNQLFGLSLNGDAENAYLIDEDGKDNLPTTIDKGTFNISYLTSGEVKDDGIQIKDILETDDITTKGKKLGNGGYMIYSFEDAETAKDYMVTFLPSGSVEDNHVYVPLNLGGLNEVTGNVTAEAVVPEPVLLDGVLQFEIDTTLGDGELTYKLPVSQTGTYNFTVDWGDGTSSATNILSYSDAENTHTYAAGGVYTVTMTGHIENVLFKTDLEVLSYAQKITNILDWTDVNVRNDQLEDSPLEWTYSLQDVPATAPMTTDLSEFFYQYNGNSSNIASWDTSNVTDMNKMFQYSTAFNQDLSGWDLSSVTDTSHMFSGTSFNQDLSGWNVSNVETFEGMFTNNYYFESDLSGWNVSNATNTSDMFSYAMSFQSDLSGWNVSNVTDMNKMFYEATFFNSDVSGWNVSNVTDMGGTFGYSRLDADISGWDVSNVTSLFGTFSSLANFNADISGWDVSNVTNMRNLFSSTGSFNQDISEWDTSNVTNMNSMFRYSSAFDQDISGWDVSNVTNSTSFDSSSNSSWTSSEKPTF